MIAEAVFIVALKSTLVMFIIAEGALILEHKLLLALTGAPAVLIMFYATALHLRGRENRGQRSR